MCVDHCFCGLHTHAVLCLWCVVMTFVDIVTHAHNSVSPFTCNHGRPVGIMLE